MVGPSRFLCSASTQSCFSVPLRRATSRRLPLSPTRIRAARLSWRMAITTRPLLDRTLFFKEVSVHRLCPCGASPTDLFRRTTQAATQHLTYIPPTTKRIEATPITYRATRSHAAPPVTSISLRARHNILPFRPRETSRRKSFDTLSAQRVYFTL